MSYENTRWENGSVIRAAQEFEHVKDDTNGDPSTVWVDRPVAEPLDYSVTSVWPDSLGRRSSR